jgi:hypothetical protein
MASSQRAGVAHLERGDREPAWSTVLALAAALGVDCRAFQEPPSPGAAKPRERPKRGG